MSPKCFWQYCDKGAPLTYITRHFDPALHLTFSWLCELNVRLDLDYSTPFTIEGNPEHDRKRSDLALENQSGLNKYRSTLQSLTSYLQSIDCNKARYF